LPKADPESTVAYPVIGTELIALVNIPYSILSIHSFLSHYKNRNKLDSPLPRIRGALVNQASQVGEE
jgi:hypothetical protein